MNNKGYSLVELIITISIVAVLSTFGFSAYRKTQDRQQARAVGETIEEILQRAQKDAVSGNKDCTGEHLGTEVNISINGVITTTAKCKLNNGTAKQVTLDNTTFANNTIILFQPLSAGFDITSPAGTQTNIDFTIQTSSLTNRIFIEKPGSIIYMGEI